jgi:hypothetical protein
MEETQTLIRHAPGDYKVRCILCGKEFRADKKSTWCLECATSYSKTGPIPELGCRGKCSQHQLDIRLHSQRINTERRPLNCTWKLEKPEICMSPKLVDIMTSELKEMFVGFDKELKEFIDLFLASKNPVFNIDNFSLSYLRQTKSKEVIRIGKSKYFIKKGYLFAKVGFKIVLKEKL